jgi:uncharacterized damage-inducible protein DinB
MRMDLLDRMLGHDHWATTTLLGRSQDLPDAQLDQRFDIGQGTLRDTFDHLIDAIDFWTRQMAAEPLADERDETRSVPDLLDRYERVEATFADLARGSRDAGRLDDTFIDHNGYPQSYGGTIVHVLNHSSLHRGEARHILERLGVSDLWDYDPQEWEHATNRIQV